MNELIFFLQIIFVVFSIVGALAFGRSALVATVSFLLILANIFVTKQITLFGFHVTSTDAYIVGVVLGFNLLQEYFGKKIAHKTIWISFFISFIFLLLSQSHLWYKPNGFDITQESFKQIFGFLPRIVAASFAAHLLSQYFRLNFYEFLRKLTSGKFLLLRNISVTIFEQAIDTLIFGFIGLYGVVHNLTDVFIVSFAIKVITIFCAAPILVFLANKMIKHPSIRFSSTNVLRKSLGANGGNRGRCVNSKKGPLGPIQKR
jgi:uncharacterized integral membrane protein (TIGR00697 family)